MNENTITSNGPSVNLEFSATVARKVKTATSMLLLSTAIQIAALIYGILKIQTLNNEFLSSSNSQTPYDAVSILSIISFHHILFFGLTIYALKEMKRSPWGWAAALSALGLSTMSWALPFAVIGLLTLLDREVRDYFISELDISL